MRSYGALNPLGTIPLPPDTVQTLLIAGSSGQAVDWPGTTDGGLSTSNRAGSHADLVCFTGLTTGGATFNFMVNLCSTHAAVPSSGTSVTTGTTGGSTGNNIPVIGEALFQIPPWSTGWSVAALSSGYVMAQVWRK
jgi:hypothetical protein